MKWVGKSLNEWILTRRFSVVNDASSIRASRMAVTNDALLNDVKTKLVGVIGRHFDVVVVHTGLDT